MTAPTGPGPEPTTAPPPSAPPVPILPGPGAPGGGNFFTRRTMNVPNYVWIGGAVLLGIVGIWWLQKSKGSGSSSADAGTVPSADSADLTTGQLATIEAQIRDLQGQQSQTVPTPTTPTPTPTAPTGSAVKGPAEYVVQPGEGLYSIAHTQWGVGEPIAYAKNATVIEAAARAHGLSSSRGGPQNQLGYHIFPGTRLVRP